MNPPNTSQSAGTEATKRPPYDGDRAAHAVSDDIDPVNVRYRAGWRLSAVLLGASLGLAGLFAYSSVVHDSPWPLLPGLVSVAIAISFFRTGILGPRISGDILYVPKASQRTLKIPIENISGAYLVRTVVAGYGLTGWVPTIWVNKREIYLLRGLATLSQTQDREVALATHSGQVVSDIYQRALATQGPDGMLATSHLGSISWVREFDRVSPHQAPSRSAGEAERKE